MQLCAAVRQAQRPAKQTIDPQHSTLALHAPRAPVQQCRTLRSDAQMRLPQHCEVALQTAALPRP